MGGGVDFGERNKTSPCLEATTVMVSMSRGDVGSFLVPKLVSLFGDEDEMELHLINDLVEEGKAEESV